MYRSSKYERRQHIGGLAPSSRQSLARVVNDLRNFNARHFPLHPDVQHGEVHFFQGYATDGKWCSVADHVHLFFALLAGRARSTVESYRWALKKHYELSGYGPTPWVTRSGGPAASSLH